MIITTIRQLIASSNGLRIIKLGDEHRQSSMDRFFARTHYAFSLALSGVFITARAVGMLRALFS